MRTISTKLACSVIIILLLLSTNLTAQTIYRIRMPSSSYSAKLEGKTGTRAAGVTVSGAYGATKNAHKFELTTSGNYELYYDAAGGSSWTKDSDWGGTNGKLLVGSDWITYMWDRMNSTGWTFLSTSVGDTSIKATAIKNWTAMVDSVEANITGSNAHFDVVATMKIVNDTLFWGYSTGGSEPIAYIENDNDDAGAGALYFIKDSDSPALNDTLGHTTYWGYNDAAEKTALVKEVATAKSVTNGDEDGRYYLHIMIDGTLREVFTVDPTFIAFNQDAQDISFLVESSASPVSFYVDGGTGYTGIMTNNLDSSLTVYLGGHFKGGLRVDLETTLIGLVTASAGITLDDSMRVGDDDFIGLGTGKGSIYFRDEASDSIDVKDANLDVELNLSAATYGSDGTVTDVELLRINSLSSNAQDQITARLIAVDYGDSLVNYDGDGLKVTNNDAIDVLVDVHGGLEIGDDSLNVKSSGVTNDMLAGSIDLTSKVTGTLPVANGGTGDTDLDDIIGGDGLKATDGANTIISGNATLEVLVDFDGAIEIGDDSLNVKLDGTTLTKSASGLKLNSTSLSSDSLIQADHVKANSSDGLFLSEDGGTGIFVEDGGNFGIRTKDPAHALHLVGNIALGDSTTGDVDAVIYFADDGDVTAESFMFNDGEDRFETTSDFYAPAHYGSAAMMTDVGAAAASALTVSAKVNEGAGISKGQALYQSGATGQEPQVSLCDNTDAAKHGFVGLAAETKTDGQTILVRAGGNLTAVDTDGTGAPGAAESWSDGDELYMSTGGLLTNVLPTSGEVHQLASVSYAHGSNGILLLTMHDPTYIAAASGEDIDIRMGDSAGSNKVSFEDYTDNEVASINSDGKGTFIGLESNVSGSAIGLKIDGNKTTGDLAQFINDDDGSVGDSSAYVNKLGHNYSPSFRQFGEGTALYLDYGSAGAEDHDPTIYFGDDGSDTAESFKWDDGNDWFELSDYLYVAGGDLALDNNKAVRIKDAGGTARVVVLYNTNDDMLFGGPVVDNMEFGVRDHADPKPILYMQGISGNIYAPSDGDTVKVQPYQELYMFDIEVDNTRKFGVDSAGNVAMTGSLATTGSRVIKGWLTDVEVTNDITIGGTALGSTYQPLHASLTSIAGLTETNGGIAYGTADNAYAWLAAGAEGTLLMGNGAGAPSFLGAGTSGYMLVAAGAADPVWTAVTGTGAPVKATSPSLVTPALGVATATTMTVAGAAADSAFNSTSGYFSGSVLIDGDLQVDGSTKVGTVTATNDATIIADNDDNDEGEIVFKIFSVRGGWLKQDYKWELGNLVDTNAEKLFVRGMGRFRSTGANVQEAVKLQNRQAFAATNGTRVGFWLENAASDSIMFGNIDVISTATGEDFEEGTMEFHVENGTGVTEKMVSIDLEGFNSHHDYTRHDSLYVRRECSNIADDGSIGLQGSRAGWGEAMIGDNEEWAQFRFSNDGTVTLIANTANVVNTDTDAKFCIYDTGTAVGIKNRLGSSKKIAVNVNYYDP